MLESIYFATMVVLIVILRKISKYNLTLGFIIIGQLTFIFLGLIVRPLILYLRQPYPEFGDAFSDSRLIVDGSYNQSLKSIGLYIFFGVTIFGVSLSIIEKFTRKKFALLEYSNLNLKPTPVFLLLILALVANFVESGGVSQNRLVTWISVSALPCAGLAVQSVYDQVSSRAMRIALFGIIGLVCFVLSLLTASKSPIFFFLFMYSLSLFRNNRGFSSSRISIKVAIFGMIILIPIISFFVFVQNIKDGAEVTFVNSRIGQKYFGNFYFLYTILKRFDLFRAVSDVWFVGQGAWYSFSGYLEIMAKSMEWNYGSTAPNFGGQWAINVLQNTPDVSNNVVSLSQSFIAEGWLLGGAIGIVFTTAIFVLLTVSIGSMVSSHLFLRVVALYVIGSNSIFEGGVVANLESLSTGVRTAILLWLPFRLLEGLDLTSLKSKKVVN